MLRNGSFQSQMVWIVLFYCHCRFVVVAHGFFSSLDAGLFTVNLVYVHVGLGLDLMDCVKAKQSVIVDVRSAVPKSGERCQFVG